MIERLLILCANKVDPRTVLVRFRDADTGQCFELWASPRDLRTFERFRRAVREGPGVAIRRVAVSDDDWSDAIDQAYAQYGQYWNSLFSRCQPPKPLPVPTPPPAAQLDFLQ